MFRRICVHLCSSVVSSCVLLAAAGACRRAPRPAVWTWNPGGLSDALTVARTEERAVLVAVEAAWCPTCHQLERDVFERSAGRLPADRLVGVKIDFDTPEGQAVVERYRVIGLPTTLLLEANGKERGRVEGYEDVDSYVAGVREALEGADRCAAALARLALAPDDPAGNAEAGAALLARGDEAEGLRLLERARTLDPDNGKKVFIEATRTIGRYYFRVKHQYDRALAHFQEGAARAGDTDAAWGFRYWTAMTLRAAGRADEASALLDRLVAENPGRPEPVAVQAEYLYMTGGDGATALRLARDAARLAPTDDWNHYLVAVLAERTGDRASALAEARRAVELAPGEAIYEHLLARLGGVGER
jgi:tetratricopeptide (TPR) repeat protein